MEPCAWCSGSGRCPACHGTGRVPCQVCGGKGTKSGLSGALGLECTFCGGSGSHPCRQGCIEGRCPACEGTGWAGTSPIQISASSPTPPEVQKKPVVEEERIPAREDEGEQKPEKKKENPLGLAIVLLIGAFIIGMIVWSNMDVSSDGGASLEASVDDAYLQAGNNLWVDLTIENNEEEPIEIEKETINIHNGATVYCTSWNMAASIVAIEPESKLDVTCFFNIRDTQISRDSPINLVIPYSESEASTEMPALDSLVAR